MNSRVLLPLATLALVVLAGCSPAPVRSTDNPAFVSAYQARFLQLQEISDWTVLGKLAISDGTEGGSGSLSWHHHPGETRMSFRGTLGKGAWRLEANPAEARLELADGSVHTARTVAQLVLNQVGWKVPVDALAWWVKGLAQPGDWELRELDEQGRITTLRQFGWDVEFGAYTDQQDQWLPSRLTARRGDYLVKLAVRRWEFQANGSELE